jgi:hypothetical protein
VADQLPELALAAIVYLLVMLVGAWIFNAGVEHGANKRLMAQIVDGRSPSLAFPLDSDQ